MKKIKTNNKGSALILVLMVTLVLSGMGLMAMRDIAVGVHHSASFRVRTQAATLSDSAASAFSMRAGNKASSYIYGMKATAKSNNQTFGSTFGGGDSSKYYPDGVTPPNSQKFREDLASHGGFVVFSNKSLKQNKGLVPFPHIPSASSSQHNETGLFRGPSGESSFEVQNETRFHVILRDIKNGIPAPGFSEKFCFKKATVAARSRVGSLPDSVSDPATIGIGIHTNEILLGPIECGYN